MSPIYEYRCQECLEEAEQLRKYEQRDEPMECDSCGGSMLRFLSAPHIGPDGMYSYAPNIGTPDAFERKQTKMEKTAEHKKDTGRTKLFDSV